MRGNEIAMVFQDPMTSLNPVLTIGRQIDRAAAHHLGLISGQANRTRHRAARDGRYPPGRPPAGDYPHQFSGGMRQRAMIAMALACGPSLLIADEPTTALDVTIQAQIIELVIRLRDRLGMAIIWITHDLGVIAGLADRVIVMYAGFIVERGRVDSIFDSLATPTPWHCWRHLPRVDRRHNRRLKCHPRPATRSAGPAQRLSLRSAAAPNCG
jgi:oligopeptide transport system ATP-binding protein